MTAPWRERVEIAGGRAVLYLGDNREVWPALLERPEIVVTSPPYNLREPGTGHLGHSTSLWRNAALANGYSSYADNLPLAEYEEWQKGLLRDWFAALPATGAIFYNHKPRPREGEVWLPLSCNPGLPVRQVVIWDRGSGFNFSPSHFMPMHEWVVIFAKQEFRLKSRGVSGIGDVWRMPPRADADHPAPFPVKLPSRIIEATSADIYADPFAGSGTTGVACMRLGRRFVGIEIDEGYFRTACRRIAEATRQPDLLIPETAA